MQLTKILASESAKIAPTSIKSAPRSSEASRRRSSVGTAEDDSDTDRSESKKALTDPLIANLDSPTSQSAKSSRTASTTAKTKASKPEKRVRMSSRRSANFTHHEKEILLSLMQTYRHVVEDKRTDGIMVKEKNAAWIELTNKYNAQNEVWTRSVKQLRQCWKNLKSRARIDLMRVNLQTTTSDSDPNSVRLNLVPLNNVSKPTDNSNQSTLNSSNNINNNTTGSIISNNNTNNINNANNNNATNIILSSILNNNNISNSNTIKSGSVPGYGLSSAAGSNSVVGLSPSLLRSGSLSNRPNSKTSGSKKRKKKKVVLNDVSSRNFAANDNNSSNSNSNSSSRRQQRLLTVSSATIGVERDDIDDEDDVDEDDDDEEEDTVAVLAADNDDDSNTIGARRRRRRRLQPTRKSTPIGDSALVDVADENDEFDEDENEEEEEEEDEDDDVEADDNDEVDDDDDDIDDSGTVDDDIYNDEDVRRSSRHPRSGVSVDGFHVEQNSDLGSRPGTAQDVDPLYSVENLAVVSVSGSADRIHFQHHANSPTSNLQNQTDGNLLHSHHPHPQLHQSQHQHQHQPPHLHSQVNNYHHSNRLSTDSITRLDDDFSSTEPDIKVFDSIRGKMHFSFSSCIHSFTYIY